MPNKMKTLGVILLIIGVLLVFLKHQFNYKPEFLNLKVFAIYSFYIEAKTFTLITHQMIEDLGGILLIAGLFMVAFSKEKAENEGMDLLRLKAFFITVWFNLFYLFFAILFFFGFGFVAALIGFAIGWLLVYIISFRWMLYKSKSGLSAQG